MDVEVRHDRAAARRFRLRARIFLIAVAVVFASYPIRPVLTTIFRAEAGGLLAQALILAGFLTAVSFPLWGSLDLVYYRCPQCRRRLSRVHPAGVAEANDHDVCGDCRVVWDLGWAWQRTGEGGG